MLRGSYYNGFAPRDGMPLYPSLWRGCVGAWAPCLGPTGLTLRDWSGFANHGTLTNTTLASVWSVNRGQYALDLDGTNDTVPLASTVARGSGDFGFSGWFNHDVLSGGAVLIGTGTGSTYLIVIDATTLYINLTSGFSSISHGGTIAAGVWNNYVLSRSGTTITIYVNGVALGTRTNSGLCDISCIGSYFGGTANFDGKIDDVRVYNRALNPSEIALLARRRGIAYDMMPMAMPYSEQAAFQAAWALRQRLILGGGGGLG